jgi:hypothetical protein
MGELSKAEISAYSPELESFSVETPGGRIHIRWDCDASATPRAQLAFFAEFLATAGVYESWVRSCPLTYTSGKAGETLYRTTHPRGLKLQSRNPGASVSLRTRILEDRDAESEFCPCAVLPPRELRGRRPLVRLVWRRVGLVGVVLVLPGSIDPGVEPRIEHYAVCGYADRSGGEGGCGRFSRVVYVP